MHIRALFFMLMMVLAGTHMVIAQPPPPPAEQSQFVFLSAVSYPDTAPARVRIDITYRIERDFFIPIRASDTIAVAPYTRSGEVLIELFDSTSSTSASRKIDRISIPESKAESDPTERSWCEGIASFSVPHGTYRVFFEVTDRQSDRRYVYRNPIMIRTIPAPQQKLMLFPIATVMPVSDLRKEKIVPDNFGNDILFNAPRQLLTAVLLPSDSVASVSVDYAITVQDPEKRNEIVAAADSNCILPVIRGYALRLTEEQNAAGYTLTASPDSRIGFIAIPLRTSSLPLRSYLLTLHARAGGQSTELVRPFKNVWPTMPRSLKNVDDAISALRFIAREGTLDSLLSGDFVQRRDALERFWVVRDPTPGTAYNETMTEYYRRVDHARTAFATLQEQDGTKSDRGRIYILNGQPTSIERKLNPSNGFTETWTYERTKRHFTFVDEKRNGAYHLIATPQ